MEIGSKARNSYSLQGNTDQNRMRGSFRLSPRYESPQTNQHQGQREASSRRSSLFCSANDIPRFGIIPLDDPYRTNDLALKNHIYQTNLKIKKSMRKLFNCKSLRIKLSTYLPLKFSPLKIGG